MTVPFATGKKAFGYCDRCGQRAKLMQLKDQPLKMKPTGLRVCPACLDQDHPQLRLGMYPIYDPQALRFPRPDTSLYSGGPGPDGFPTSGSRSIEWGWRPVGGAPSGFGLLNSLVSFAALGTVSTATQTGNFLFANASGDILMADEYDYLASGA